MDEPESYSLFKLAWQQRLDAADLGVIDNRVADLRDAVERLREDLRRRIGSTRSRLALVNRFKLRCEWHDRERMLAVAGDDHLAGGPEDRLTGEFARYLFDAGLSPLTKSLAGGLEPDLLDPSASFYVEARQFTSSSARGDIVNGVKQVLDSVGSLRGGPYAVDEAFCVVFRRDGPYYDLPAVLQTDTYRLHLVLVDLARPRKLGDGSGTSLFRFRSTSSLRRPPTQRLRGEQAPANDPSGGLLLRSRFSWFRRGWPPLEWSWVNGSVRGDCAGSARESVSRSGTGAPGSSEWCRAGEMFVGSDEGGTEMKARGTRRLRWIVLLGLTAGRWRQTAPWAVACI